VLKSLKTPCHWLGASERNLEWGDNRLSSAVARAYNGGLGAESPAGLHGAELPMGNQGAKPPEAEKLFYISTSSRSSKFIIFSVYLKSAQLITANISVALSEMVSMTIHYLVQV